MQTYWKTFELKNWHQSNIKQEVLALQQHQGRIESQTYQHRQGEAEAESERQNLCIILVLYTQTGVSLQSCDRNGLGKKVATDQYFIMLIP